MIKVIDLGWCLAKLIVKEPEDGPKTYYKLEILSPSISNEDTGLFIPAQSIEVWGDQNIKSLKKLLEVEGIIE